MSDSRALYEQVILDHNRKPRNFHALEDADHTIEGFNPLCGDHFTIYLKIGDGTITDAAFSGAGCAISKSSASLMTTVVKGKTLEEARRLFKTFHQMVTSPPDSLIDKEALGKLRVFSGVREFPIRIKCATLAWHAMASAIEGKSDAITTE